MAPTVAAKAALDPSKEASLSLSWKENPTTKRVLDVIVSILVKEYIQIAKENPEIFSE